MLTHRTRIQDAAGWLAVGVAAVTLTAHNAGATRSAHSAGATRSPHGASAVSSGHVAYAPHAEAATRASQATEAAGGGSGSGRRDIPEAERAVRILAEGLQTHASLPGIALAVGVGERIVFSEAFGFADVETRTPATPLTRFRIGSVGKSLTAAGAVLLAERGRLDLDARVDRYVPSVGGEAGGATARQLAGHLGGIRHYEDGEYLGRTRYEDVVDALELFIDDTLVAAPGAAYEYSTHGYTLLSAVMQRAAGRPFLPWMRANVFEPMGMRSTGADLPDGIVPYRASFYRIEEGELVPARYTDNSYKWAGGGLLSTPEDLVRFGLGLLEGELLSEDGVRTLFTSQRTATGEETGYGMGFRPRRDREGRRVVHHGGSSEGGRTFLLLYPRERVVVAMAANRSTAPLFEEEAQTVGHFFLEHGPRGDAALDLGLSGAWSFDGELGDDAVEGDLRLYGEGGIRGVLDWSDTQEPIRILVADRHAERLRLIGVGPHGLMNMWLAPDGGGWAGRWDYRGRRGRARLR